MTITGKVAAEPSVAVGGQAGDAGWLSLAVMSFVHFLNDGSANYLPGILPAVLVMLHEPVSLAGAIMAALLIGQALQPLMGRLADWLGGNSLIVIGATGSAIGGGLLGFAHNLSLLIGDLLLISVGNALFHPQALAAVRSQLKRRQALGLAFFLIGGELGRGIWPVVTGWIVVHAGIASLWFTALPAIVMIPFIVRIAPHLPARRARAVKIDWRRHRGPFVGLVGYAGLRAFVTYGLVTFIPLLWHLRGGSLIGGASIITTLISVGVVGNLAGGHLVDRFGRRPVVLLSSVVVIGLVPLLAAVSGVFVWIMAALLGIVLFSSSSVTVLIGQDIFSENRSLGSGIALGLGNGVGALLVFVVGFWLSVRTIGGMFWLLAAASALSIAFALAIPGRYMGTPHVQNQ